MRKLILFLVLLLMYTIQSAYGANAYGSFEKIGKLKLVQFSCPNYHNKYYYAHLTKLIDGKILISFGGCLFEVFNPYSNKLESVKQPSVCRPYVEPVLLDDGRVFIPGSLDSLFDSLEDMRKREDGVYAEIYDPKTDTYTRGAKMNIPRNNFAITKLPDGKLLVTGGLVPDRHKYVRRHSDTLDDPIKFEDHETAYAEIYDPSNDKYILAAKTTLEYKVKNFQVGDKIMSKFEYNEYINSIKTKNIKKYPSGDLRNRMPVQLVPEAKEFETTNYIFSGEALQLDNGNVLRIANLRGNTEIYDFSEKKFVKAKSVLTPFFTNGKRFLNIQNLKDGKFIIMNCDSDFFGNRIFIYDSKNTTLTELPKSSVERWDCLISFAVGRNDSIILHGGYIPDPGIGKGGKYVRDMELYNIKSNKYTHIGKSPRGYVLYKSILLDDGNIMFIAYPADDWRTGYSVFLYKVKKHNKI